MRIKVVAEIEKERPITATATASCPDCGEIQAIYAHRVVSVTSEKEEKADRPV
jgi:ribosomal protein S27E